MILARSCAAGAQTIRRAFVDLLGAVAARKRGASFVIGVGLPVDGGFTAH